MSRFVHPRPTHSQLLLMPLRQQPGGQRRRQFTNCAYISMSRAPLSAEPPTPLNSSKRRWRTAEPHHKHTWKISPLPFCLSVGIPGHWIQQDFAADSRLSQDFPIFPNCLFTRSCHAAELRCQGFCLSLVLSPDLIKIPKCHCKNPMRGLRSWALLASRRLLSLPTLWSSSVTARLSILPCFINPTKILHTISFWGAW